MTPDAGSPGDWTSFGARMRMARRAARFTQPQLAERAGLSRSSICNIENGRQYPPLGDMYAIAAKLDVDPVWLATGRASTAGVVAPRVPAAFLQEITACATALAEVTSTLRTVTRALHAALDIAQEPLVPRRSSPHA